MLRLLITPSVALAITALPLAGAARAATNLLQNGSFETGSFASWTATRGDATTFVDGSATTGRHYDQATDGHWLALFGSTRADGGASIAQTFATTPGARYLLSFDLANANGGGAAANSFSASIDAAVLFSSSGLGDQDYVRYTAAFSATGPSATLTLFGFNDASYIELDDVTITAVPEPAMAWLCLAGLGVLAAARGGRRRRA